LGTGRLDTAASGAVGRKTDRHQDEALALETAPDADGSAAAVAVGLDLGASLTKLAVRRPGAAP